jgi:4-hydroxy-2-oxoheptanedioate aldolase
MGYDRLSFDNSLKVALAERRRQIGCWLTIGSATASEIASNAGFDWLLIDMEHSPNDLREVVEQLRAVNGGGAEPVVRVPWNEPILVKRLLDQGVRSLMFPNVQSADEARAAVASTRYPPAGIRGVAGTSRATDYGRRAGYAARYDAELCVIVQLETPSAIAAASEIAAVPGIDGVFIGPNDLAASMGSMGAIDSEPVADAISSALGAVLGAGRAAGILDFKPASALARFDAGFSFIAVGGDAFALARSLDALTHSFKKD